MKGRLLLDVVVGDRVSVLYLVVLKDQELLVRRNALLVLDLGLGHVDVCPGDGLASSGVHRLYWGGDHVTMIGHARAGMGHLN